jgi:mannose-6-phosphate isomerase-like protein (cupin superfamily)
MAGSPVIVREADGARETFADPARGDAAWATFFSADATPTSAMSAGLMELPPGGSGLRPHRHAQPEIYYVAAGSGVVTVDAVEIEARPGMALFIPGEAEHAVRNTGETALRIFYVFPADRFSDVIYRFSPPA